MKKLLILLLIPILLLTVFKSNNKSKILIPTDSIRLRVISNSNDEIDIKTKMELKSYLENILFNLISDINNKEDAEKIIVSNLDDINNKIYDYLGHNNYKIDFGLNYFPSKVYKGVVYEEGMYDSLVVTLGNGKGNNWWCVLFPPLCLLEENNNTTDVEYKLFVSRIIEAIR